MPITKKGPKIASRKPPRSKIQTQCACCGRKIAVQPSRMEKSKSGLVFCSHTCSAQYHSSILPHNAQCLYCGRTFHRSPSEMKRGHNTYCSRACYEKARQAGIAAKRERRVPAGRDGNIKVQCAYCGKAIYLRPSRVRTVKNHYCSRECKRLHQTTTGSHVPRERLRCKYGRCQICGLDEPDILVIHHKDGNRTNNDESNLMVLCPNCHARIHRRGKG